MDKAIQQQINDLQRQVTSLESRYANVANPTVIANAYFFAKLSETLSAGGSAKAKLWRDEGSGVVDTGHEITVYDYLTETGGSYPSGTKLQVGYFTDRKWYAMGGVHIVGGSPGYSSSDSQVLINDSGSPKYVTVSHCHVFNSTNQTTVSANPNVGTQVAFDNFHIKEAANAFTLNSSNELTVVHAGDYSVSLTAHYQATVTSSTGDFRAWIERYDTATTTWKKVRNSLLYDSIKFNRGETRCRVVQIRATANEKFRVRASYNGYSITLYGSSATTEEREGWSWTWHTVLP